MNHSFPRLLTLLRKEKKLSQKEAAKDLGISQALLSHYENGIRECGLDFLVKAADYYQVSCDYLLGKTPDRTGAAKKRPAEAGAQEMEMFMQSIKTLQNMTEAFQSDELKNAVQAYMEKAFYKIFRLLYTANSKNPQNLFGLNRHVYRSQISAEMLILENRIDLMVRGKAVPGVTAAGKGEAPAFFMDALTHKDAAAASALLSLIKQAEQ